MNDLIEKHVKAILAEIGEDPTRDGLERTPQRVAKAYRFLTKGYSEDPVELLNGALFDVSYDEMVLVKDIGFYSLCEHHLLPFFGRVHVAYIPNGKIVGLSKIPRLVEMFARRLQVQERLTMQVAEVIEKVLSPRGVAVVAEAIHLCMMMRGVEQQNAFAITSSQKGTFQSDPKTRSEFMELIRHRKESFARSRQGRPQRGPSAPLSRRPETSRTVPNALLHAQRAPDCRDASAAPRGWWLTSLQKMPLRARKKLGSGLETEYAGSGRRFRGEEADPVGYRVRRPLRHETRVP